MLKATELVFTCTFHSLSLSPLEGPVTLALVKAEEQSSVHCSGPITWTWKCNSNLLHELSCEGRMGLKFLVTFFGKFLFFVCLFLVVLWLMGILVP